MLFYVLLVVLVSLPGMKSTCMDSLPSFRDTEDLGTPEYDRFQAIVPAYRFHCSGRVTEWGACVQPGRVEYYIRFQVWRPRKPSGCYSLVGYNYQHNNSGVVSTNERQSDSTQYCFKLTVSDYQQFVVQPGDVVGYYVDRIRSNNGGGIQWIMENNNNDDQNDDRDIAVVHYKKDLPRGDIQSHYAINGLNPTECDISITRDSDLYFISSSTTATPLISFSIAVLVKDTRSKGDSHNFGSSSMSGFSPSLEKKAISSLKMSFATTMPFNSLSCSFSNGFDCKDHSDSDGSKYLGALAVIVVLILIIILMSVIIILLRRRWKRNKMTETKNDAYNVYDFPIYSNESNELNYNSVYELVTSEPPTPNGITKDEDGCTSEGESVVMKANLAYAATTAETNGVRISGEISYNHDDYAINLRRH